MKKQRGVTLLELMIVVVLLGILASIAYPSYQAYVGRGYRAEAHTQLNRIANLQEQYFMDNRTFTTDLTKLGLNASPYLTDSQRYSIVVIANVLSGASGSFSYTVTATAQGAQVSLDSGCPSLQLTMEGAKTPVGCW